MPYQAWQHAHGRHLHHLESLNGSQASPCSWMHPRSGLGAASRRGTTDVQIGMTCAACHNAQLNYQGKRIRIDGGAANTFDMMGYVNALDDAVQATLADKQKFDRLAVKLGAMSDGAKSELGKRFEREAA